jgi:hypothetical protein
MSYKGVGNKFPLGKEEFDRRVEFLSLKYNYSFHINVWNII